MANHIRSPVAERILHRGPGFQPAEFEPCGLEARATVEDTRAPASRWRVAQVSLSDQNAGFPVPLFWIIISSG